MAYKGEKKKQYQKEWIAKRRAKFFEDKVCVDCGAKENLQLHHIDPDKKEGHSIWSWSKQRIENEVKKCEVKCKQCHERFHAAQRYKGHGCTSRYRNGCRCSLCKESNRKRHQDYKRRKLEGLV